MAFASPHPRRNTPACFRHALRTLKTRFRHPQFPCLINENFKVKVSWMGWGIPDSKTISRRHGEEDSDTISAWRKVLLEAFPMHGLVGGGFNLHFPTDRVP